MSYRYHPMILKEYKHCMVSEQHLQAKFKFEVNNKSFTWICKMYFNLTIKRKFWYFLLIFKTFCTTVKFQNSIYKKWSFPIRTSSVNVTKSKRNCGIWSHLLKKSLIENFIFCGLIVLNFLVSKLCYNGLMYLEPCQTSMMELFSQK